ncbi:cytochrome P450 [Ganoderma leucocontextum]|nr:cytochrome P450 [Ganoderma leucocontextum]
MSPDLQNVFYASLAVFVTWYIIKWRTDPLRAIPTVGGPSAPILSYLTAMRTLQDSKGVLQEGYAKYYNSTFRIALLDQWVVVLTGKQLVEDLRKRPESELSLAESIEDIQQVRFTVGRETLDDPYHVDVIRDKLTRMIPAVLPDVVDELSMVLPEYIATGSTDDWVEVSVWRSMLNVIARISNRVFVGPPLCRDKEYLELAIDFALDINSDGALISYLPKFMKPFVGHYISGVRKAVRRTVPLFTPVLKERRANMKEYGEAWSDKPNDGLQWVLDIAVPKGYNDMSIVERLLFINSGAIHTTSNSLTHALYDLASMPEHIEPLREEVEPIIVAEGWTKNAITRMSKLDSFLKESTRIHGIVLTSLTRKALKDVTLVDGTVIPKGTSVAAPQSATHLNEEYYPDASTFDPFRFSRAREKEGESLRHQFVNTSTEFIAFGHGKHACPGRFFAVNELKTVVAYILLHYDLKLGGDGTRPKNVYLARNILPDPSGKVLFRKRKRRKS